SALRDRARCRPQRARTRHSRRLGERDREFPAVDDRRTTLRATLSLGDGVSALSITPPFDLPPEQTGAAAWYGPEIARRSDWLLPLSPAEIAEVEATTKALAARR